MYEQFYELDTRPFQLTPDPEFYFESLTHRKALSYLGYGLAQGEGFIIITGEVGAGKTTLVGHLMATIDRARLTVANIVTSGIDAGGMVALAAHHFGIPTDGRSKSDLLGAFENFLHDEARAGRRCLLIVDEAQNLCVDALEELRMLSNFQLGGHALLQIFLLGQPEFRQKYQQAPELEQLRQRVIAHHHLGPMAADEVEPYIAHRLTKAGWTGRPTFTDDVFDLIHDETGGVPRVINNLMSRVLLMGAVEQVEEISAALVYQVLADMDDDCAQSVASQSTVSALHEETPVTHDEEWTAAEPAIELEAVDTDKPRKKPAPTVDNAVRTIAQIRAEADAAKAAVDAAIASSQKSGRSDDETLARVDELSQRLSLIEERMESAEGNLRRVLAMLVDWVETDVRARDHYVSTGRAA